MAAVVDAVCADDQLTRQERALMIQLAGLLDLRDLEVEALLARAEGLVSRVSTDVGLKPGTWWCSQACRRLVSGS